MSPNIQKKANFSKLNEARHQHFEIHDPLVKGSSFFTDMAIK